jgi:unsaturated chondroitin disaccharide hydrolase
MKKYTTVIEENREWAEDLFERLEKKLSVMTVRSRDKIPDRVDERGIHNEGSPLMWTSGFWGGLNLLMYKKTGKESYLLTAKSTERRQDEVFSSFEEFHHDVGFMWHILSGALYRITGDERSKNRNLWAASSLMSRFVLGGGFIRAWNDSNAKGWPARPVKNWTIIDCMMNLPLLYWASDVIEDDRFKRIAMAHADKTIAAHLRPDGSVIHIVEHDRDTGEVVETFGGQGYEDGSSWSRGQAWGLYGFVLSYLATGETRYLDTAKRIANYFIASCIDDWLPRVDFRAPDEPVYYDTSAATCAACGLLELARSLPENEGGAYALAAVKIIRAVTEHFLNLDESSDEILSHGTERYPVPGKYSEAVAGVHRTLIYADYFLVEALLKLIGEEFNPWVG